MQRDLFEIFLLVFDIWLQSFTWGFCSVMQDIRISWKHKSCLLFSSTAHSGTQNLLSSALWRRCQRDSPSETPPGPLSSSRISWKDLPGISPLSSDRPELAPSPLSAAEQCGGRQISLSVHPLKEERGREKRNFQKGNRTKSTDFTIIYSFYYTLPCLCICKFTGSRKVRFI